MDAFVMTVGWLFISTVGALGAAVVVVLIGRFWPVRLTVGTHRRRAKRGLLPARIDWRSGSGSYNELRLIAGLSSRGKTRWFFGLMLFGTDGYDPALQPKIIRSKPEDAA